MCVIGYAVIRYLCREMRDSSGRSVFSSGFDDLIHNNWNSKFTTFLHGLDFCNEMKRRETSSHSVVCEDWLEHLKKDNQHCIKKSKLTFGSMLLSGTYLSSSSESYASTFQCIWMRTAQIKST